jgi:hypothetical protein
MIATRRRSPPSSAEGSPSADESMYILIVPPSASPAQAKAFPPMWRAILEPVLLFSIPFAAYALFHLLQRRWPFIAELWTRGVVSTLAIVGLAAAIGGMALLGLSTRNQGTYIPAHIENGRLVPGRFE